MRISCWSIGKANESYIKEGVELFTKRISHYYKIDWKIMPTVAHSASLTPQEIKLREGAKILEAIQPEDYLLLLDEKGKNISSPQLAELITAQANRGLKQVVILIGGAFGVDEKVKQRANFTWSLSNLVFPHQLVRLMLAEQLYRACSIINNEKYHHA